MITEYYHNSTGNASEIIRSGGIVAVPTETVYGLAGNGLDSSAVSKIYEVKGRPEIKPLALMIPGSEEIDQFCLDVPEQARRLAEKFWPGPLSIVLKAKTDIVPDIVRAGGETVSLRCPASPLTLQALKEAGVPFAAPSANPSGEKSPKTAEEVKNYFDGTIDAIIDGGECSLGIESTIISMDSAPFKILRQGALSKEVIEKELVAGMDIIGITGGSGSGKTTALESLRLQNALIIDCDALYHSLLETSEKMIENIEGRFAGVVSNGKVDRKKLGNIVFSDPQALIDLNGITHTVIRDEIEKRMREFAMNGGRIVGLDAVELISSGIGDICRLTVAITAPKEDRVRRIILRDGISEDDALKRINAQHSDEYYREHCDIVIENNGNIEEMINCFLKKVSEG